MAPKLYLAAVHTVEERLPDPPAWPFTMPFVRGLDLRLTAPVTFFVGENGTGKSTLLEAIAVLAGLPSSGGGRNEVGQSFAPQDATSLASVLRPSFTRRPRDAYFFRAELQAHFASLLEERRADPFFNGDPYGRYGGRSLHAQSHGEAFLSVMQNRLGCGFYLFDEPEAALSPQRQLALLALMHELSRSGSQFIVATHSPVLLTFPGAAIVSFDSAPLAPVRLEDTSHYRITRGILENPRLYWRHLTEP